jgi:dihydroorotase
LREEANVAPSKALFATRGGAGSLVIAGGRVIDPAGKVDRVADLHLVNGKVERIEAESRLPEAGLDRPGPGVLDARGKIVCPGLVDVHVHFREPGREDEETIVTGSRAAVAGGFTSVCCMPNTDPAIDSQEIVRFIYRQAEQALCKVYPIAAITRGRKGEQLTDIGELHQAGAVAISDDGSPVEKALMMRRALLYARPFGIPVASHCEEPTLAAGGAMHEGFIATKIGLRGIPALSEELMVAREIELAADTGGRMHICHISTARSVAMVRDAKKRGVPVTAEATPHHFTLTDELIAERFDTNLKVNPPLRTAADVRAIIKGLQDGTIDCIASDHAPHAIEEKELEFDQAPFGLIGLETTLALGLTELVAKKKLDLPALIALLSCRAAAVFGLSAGTLKPGAAADVCVFAPDEAIRFEAGEFYSRSQNSPFAGCDLRGRVHQTVVDGHLVFDRRQG